MRDFNDNQKWVILIPCLLWMAIWLHVSKGMGAIPVVLGLLPPLYLSSLAGRAKKKQQELAASNGACSHCLAEFEVGDESFEHLGNYMCPKCTSLVDRRDIKDGFRYSGDGRHSPQSVSNEAKAMP